MTQLHRKRLRRWRSEGSAGGLSRGRDRDWRNARAFRDLRGRRGRVNAGGGGGGARGKLENWNFGLGGRRNRSRGALRLGFCCGQLSRQLVESSRPERIGSGGFPPRCFFRLRVRLRKWWRSQSDRLNCFGFLKRLRRIAQVRPRERWISPSDLFCVAAEGATYGSRRCVPQRRSVARVWLRKR